MALQGYLGRAGTGKTTYIFDQIQERLQQEPCGPPLIYLVPEQATHQAEVELASRTGGTIRAQVLSFGRLAYRLIQECGGGTRVPVDELGKQMVLRLLMERHRDDLRMFHRAASQPGFTAHLARLVSECKSFGVSPDLLERDDWGPGTLADKLHDIRLLLRAYDEYLGDGYYDTDEMLGRVAQHIARSTWLRGAEVWMDGFNGFTRQEFVLIGELLKHTRQVTVALCLDPATLEGDGQHDLFQPAVQTWQRLVRAATEAGVPVDEPKIFAVPRRFVGAPWLAAIEQDHFAWSKRQSDATPARSDEVMIVTAANRRAEVEAAALKMLTLAREEGYRWRDMAVLLRQMDGYAEEISSVLSEFGIPFFLDRKRPVLHHPLVELVRSALETVASRWRYESVFRCFKTDLIRREGATLREARSEVDLLENYVLAYGITAAHWAADDPWMFHQEDRQYDRVDEIRRAYARPLLALERELARAAGENVRSMTEAVYHFLTDLDAARTLEAWQRDAERAGDLETAREHGQVWNGLMAVLDQIVEVLGEEQMDIPTYARVLDSGLESLRLGQVPPSLDQVVVGAMERSRQPEVKALFLLGVNEGIIPFKHQEEGILDEPERERLEAAGIELAPSAKQRLLAEPYLLYQGLTRPTERLWLSCALADAEGKPLLPSAVLERVREVLPGVPWRFYGEGPTGDPAADAELLGPPAHVFRQLLTLLQRVKRGAALDPFWWEIYDWFAGRSPEMKRERWLLSGLDYRNRARPLSPETSRALYGTRLQMSVSRLERFQQCPFMHYAAHGLKLQERPLFRLERFDVGELFHASLKRAVEWLNESRQSWSELTEEASMQLADRVVDELVPQTRSSILNRTARYRFLTGKLKRAVGRAISVLAEHAKRSRFAPVAVEISFGPGGDLPGLVIALPDGTTLQLVGRIDRVDQSVEEGHRYLRVIDYKSSAKELSLSDVWHGLNLQLLVYLDVVLEHAETWLGSKADVGGVFYYQVADPLVSAKRLLTPEEAARERSKKLKMKGLMLADTELAVMMDEQVREGSSELLPVGLKKDGGFTAWSSVATPDQFEALKTHVRRLIRDISRHMVDGDIRIAPYAQGQLMACGTCSYRSVCQFDPAQEGNRPRILPRWKDEQVWEMLMQGDREGNEEARVGREDVHGNGETRPLDR